MMNREQAQVVGEAVIEQWRSQELERKNAAARRVPWLYRFPELKAFEAWERPVVVAAAAKHAMREKSVLAAWAISVAMLAAPGYAAWPLLNNMSFGWLWIWLASCVIMAPVIWYRRTVAGKYISEKASRRLTGKHAVHVELCLKKDCCGQCLPLAGFGL